MRIQNVVFATLILTPKHTPWHDTRKENCYIITKSIHTINKIKIKMLSRRRIEPTPTGEEAGIQIELVTCIWTLRFSSRQLGSYTTRRITRGVYFNGKRFHFRVSAFLKWVKFKKNAFLKQSKCVRFDYLQFGPPFYASWGLLQAGYFFIITGKHPFEMQKVRKDLA